MNEDIGEAHEEDDNGEKHVFHEGEMHVVHGWGAREEAILMCIRRRNNVKSNSLTFGDTCLCGRKFDDTIVFKIRSTV